VGSEHNRYVNICLLIFLGQLVFAVAACWKKFGGRVCDAGNFGKRTPLMTEKKSLKLGHGIWYGLRDSVPGTNGTRLSENNGN